MVGSDRLLKYQEYVALVRRYDRSALLYGLSQLSRGWNGKPLDEDGVPKRDLPWNIAGAANIILGRGTTGGHLPNLDDCSRIAHEFSRIEPFLGPNGLPDLQSLAARWIYQQWPFNRFDRREWARTIALFTTTEWPDGYVPEVMHAGWDVELLGAPVEDFVSIAMLLWASANQGSRYPFPWDPSTEPIRDALGGQQRIDSIVHRNFTTSLEAFKSNRLAAIARIPGSPATRYAREPFAFNPLFATPYVGGILPGEWLAPCAPAVSMRVGVAGIAYAGVAKWSEGFFHDLGHLFEQYISRHLRQLEAAVVVPEVIYLRKKEEHKTVDWFVETLDAVYLIECKSALPDRRIREGDLGVANAHARALEKGVRQLNRTRKVLLNGQPELDHISSTKPLIGLLTTLGNFDLAGEEFVRAGLPAPDFPIAIVSAEFIERLVTLSPDEFSSLGQAVAEHLDSRGFVKVAWTDGAVPKRNKLLDQAFESIPIIEISRELGVPIDE